MKFPEMTEKESKQIKLSKIDEQNGGGKKKMRRKEV